MENTKRWLLAQDKEKVFWEKFNYKLNGNIEVNNLYINIIKKYMNLTNSSNILEIGASPIGVITIIDNGKLYALDPLMDTFKSNSTLKQNIEWIKGKGEELPFADSSLDLVIISNTLDHAEDPKKILNEIFRVLKDDGYLLLTSNIFSPISGKIMKFLEIIKCGDPCHPFHFTLNEIRKNIYKFNIKHEQIINLQSDIGSNESNNYIQKFKKYYYIDGLLFTIKLSIFTVVKTLLDKICKKATHNIFFVQKPKGLNTE